MWWLWLLAGWEGIVQIGEFADRDRAYKEARAYANAAEKPLLVIGCEALPARHPCGDVCLDVDPTKGACPNTVQGDIRAISFADKTFGAVLASHVLEHLHTTAEVRLALSEMQRVADAVYILTPSKLSLLAWLHPEHHLWVQMTNSCLEVEQR